MLLFQDQVPSIPDGLELHKESWVGAINLPEEQVKQICQMFKCTQCRTNDHTLPSCPLLKNWIIKRKPRLDNNGNPDNHSKSVGGVNSVLAAHITGNDTDGILSNNTASDPVTAAVFDDHQDTFGNVEFDLHEEPNSLDTMTTSEQVSAYSDLNIPLGSVHSALSSQVNQDLIQNSIIDSGCTRHMFPFKEAFTT